jgi:hypothetical protein
MDFAPYMARSQFWSQLSKLVNVCERPIDRFASVNGDLMDHPEPRFADLESGLGSRPRGFESRILRPSPLPMSSRQRPPHGDQRDVAGPF